MEGVKKTISLLLGVLLFNKCFRVYCQDLKVCADELPATICKGLKTQCRSHYSRMKNYCPKTCNFCNGVCIDLLKYECRRWIWRGACKTHPKILKKYCKKSCGFCGASASPLKPACASSRFGCCWDKVTKALGPNGFGCQPCKNHFRFCPKFYMDCVSGRNKRYMLKYCSATCRLCRSSRNRTKVKLMSKTMQWLKKTG